MSRLHDAAARPELALQSVGGLLQPTCWGGSRKHAHLALLAAAIQGKHPRILAFRAEHREARRSTGEQKVSIGPVVTALDSDGATTTEAIKSAEGSPMGHIGTPAALVTAHSHDRPYADDSLLLTPVAEESLAVTAAAPHNLTAAETIYSPATHHVSRGGATHHVLATSGIPSTAGAHERHVAIGKEVQQQHDDALSSKHSSPAGIAGSVPGARLLCNSGSGHLTAHTGRTSIRSTGEDCTTSIGRAEAIMHGM